MLMEGNMNAYINALHIEDVPWARMFTAAGTAANYAEILAEMEQEAEPAVWLDLFDALSDFETQGTLFPPAPFAMVFLVRMLRARLAAGTSESTIIAEKLTERLLYYAGICRDAEQREHEPPLPRFADMLNAQYLLDEDIDEDSLEELFEDPDFVPPDLFYSFYYYTSAVLSQVSGILEQYGKTASAEKFKVLYEP